jgi:DNA-binding IclR family transcriptional regulator
MDISKYPPTQQLSRCTEILGVLFQHGARGLTPGQIATATSLAPAYVTQQLGQMANLGLVDELATLGRWRPGVRWAQMATALHLQIQRDLRELEEFQQRITRN